MTNRVQLNDLYPLLRETLEGGGVFTLTVTGSSMLPLLADGRDRVTLSSAPERLRKNDLLLYRRRDGAFVLHRLVRIERDGTLTFCGDRQWQKEPGLRREQVVGIVTAYERKGRAFTNRALGYRVYRTVWTWLLPARRWIFAIYGRFAARRHGSA